ALRWKQHYGRWWRHAAPRAHGWTASARRDRLSRDWSQAIAFLVRCGSGVRCSWPLPGALPVRPLSEAAVAQARVPIQSLGVQMPSVTGTAVDAESLTSSRPV
ncbi:unnamed protein product, partial [Prorocentrum cordatum]